MNLKLFWWNKKQNFGDAISPLIVEYVSERSVEYADAAHCELVSVGSVLQLIAGAANKKLGPPKSVWGSGVFERSEPTDKMIQSDHVRIRAVRGPLTATLLGLQQDITFGDPGILCDRVFGRPVDILDKIGIVPHISHWRSKEYIAKLNAVEGARVIDVRNPDPLSVVKEIASCEVIFSSSLHGLIVADSYSVPNLWLRGPSLDQTDLKFYDYGLSVNRANLKPYSLKDCIDLVLRGNIDVQLATSVDLEPRKDALVANFPDELARPR